MSWSFTCHAVKAAPRIYVGKTRTLSIDTIGSLLIPNKTAATLVSNSSVHTKLSTLIGGSTLAHTTSSISRVVAAPRVKLGNRKRAYYSTEAPRTVPVPSMGDSISEGVVLSWSKKPGDQVKTDETVVSLETDKITVEVRAPYDGVIDSTLADVGQKVLVGADLFTIRPGKSSSSKAETPAPKASTPPAASKPTSEAKPSSEAKSTPSNTSGEKISVQVPTLTESVTSGVIGKFLINSGSPVSADQVVLTIETDKVTVDVRAPTSGLINDFLVKSGQEVKVGDVLFNMTKGDFAAPKESSPAAPKPEQTKEAPKPAPQAPKTSTTPTPSKTSSSTIERTDSRVRMSQARKRTAQRLKDSQNTAAILTTFNEVDMQALVDLRDRYKDKFLEKFGVKLGYMSAFAKASAIALMENPVVNAVMDGDDIVYRNYVDISVAVSTPTALFVPVLRNVEAMSFADIERQIGEFGVKAKENRLTIEEMSGGTFTISNGGVFGSMMGTPIINPPQSAILGMHAITKRPIVVNDKIEIRPVMYIALSYDHRIIDGRDAVTTLKRIKTLLEDPVSMLLEL